MIVRTTVNYFSEQIIDCGIPKEKPKLRSYLTAEKKRVAIINLNLGENRSTYVTIWTHPKDPLAEQFVSDNYLSKV